MRSVSSNTRVSLVHHVEWEFLIWRRGAALLVAPADGDEIFAPPNHVLNPNSAICHPRRWECAAQYHVAAPTTSAVWSTEVGDACVRVCVREMVP